MMAMQPASHDLQRNALAVPRVSDPAQFGSADEIPAASADLGLNGTTRAKT